MSPSLTSLLKPSCWAAAVVLFGSLFVSQSTVSAATITWGAATNVATVSDVSTTGTYVDSATFFTSDVSVNGVTFNHRIADAPNYAFANGSNIGIAYTPESFQNNPTSGTDYVAPYPDLLSYNGYKSGGSGTITLGNLTPNQQYQVQVWSTYWSDTTPVHFTVFDGTVTLTDWRTPQYSIGTFTADNSGSQVISFTPGQSGYSFTPGAVQLRAIPEPATLTLGALGLALLCASRCRRRSVR